MEEITHFPYSLFSAEESVNVSVLSEIALFYEDMFIDRAHLRRRVHQSEIISQETILQRFTLDIDFGYVENWKRKNWKPKTFFMPILWYQKRIPLMAVDCCNEDNMAMNIARSTEYRAAMSFAILGLVLSERFRSEPKHLSRLVEGDFVWMDKFLDRIFVLLGADYQEGADLFSDFDEELLNEIDKRIGYKKQQFKEIVEFIWMTYTLCVVIDAKYLERGVGLIKLETPVPINITNNNFRDKIHTFFRYLLDPVKTFEIELPEFGEHDSACHARFKAPEGTEIVNVRLCPAISLEEDTEQVSDKLPILSSVVSQSAGTSALKGGGRRNYWKLLEIYSAPSIINSTRYRKLDSDEKLQNAKTEELTQKSKKVALILFDETNLEIQDIDLVSLPYSSWKAEISIVPELRHFHYPALYVLFALVVLFILRAVVPVNEVLVSGLTAGIAFLANAQKHYHLSRIIQEERFALVSIIAASIPLSLVLDMERWSFLYMFLDWLTIGLASRASTACYSVLFAVFYAVVAILFYIRIRHYQRYGESKPESTICVK